MRPLDSCGLRVRFACAFTQCFVPRLATSKAIAIHEPKNVAKIIPRRNMCILMLICVFYYRITQFQLFVSRLCSGEQSSVIPSFRPNTLTGLDFNYQDYTLLRIHVTLRFVQSMNHWLFRADDILVGHQEEYLRSTPLDTFFRAVSHCHRA